MELLDWWMELGLMGLGLEKHMLVGLHSECMWLGLDSCWEGK